MSKLDDLAGLLRREEDIAQEILRTIEEQKDALMRIDVDAVMRSVVRQQSLLATANDLERKRRQLLHAIAPSLFAATPPEKIHSMAELAQRHRDVIGDAMAEACVRLSRLAKKIQEANRMNRLLLESAARFVRGSLRILTRDFSRSLVDQRV